MANDKISKKFSLAELVQSPSLENQTATKQVIQKIPVKKPHKQEFVRVRSGEDYTAIIGLLQLKEDNQFYLVNPKLKDMVPGIEAYRVYLAINRQKQLFIWPVKLPNPDGRQMGWTLSAMDAVNEAKQNWVKVVANMSAQGYEVHGAVSALSEPEWPEKSLEDLVEIAFKGFYIEDENHFVFNQLLGKA